MKTILRSTILFLAIALSGCVTKTVDISYLSKEGDLERFVGQKVVFSGKCLTTKQLAISNGKVVIEVHRTGSFALDRDTTITGVLCKDTLRPLTQTETGGLAVQAAPPGVHYFIK
jgi:hypothetical protein